MSTPKTGTRLAALAGLACAACCALPLLVATGALSGSAAAFLSNSLPVTAAVLAVLAVGVFALAARRTTKTQGCGCAGKTQKGTCRCAATRT